MKPSNSRIIVSVNPEQKDTFKIGSIEMSGAMKFATNYRFKSPVVATVIEGNEHLRNGDTIITHHNNFYLPSPFHLEDNIFSISAGKTIFAKLLTNGDLMPLYGNIFCERIGIPTYLPLPPEQRKKYINRVKIIDKGWTPYQNGQIAYHRPNAAYDIVYPFGGELKTITKLDSEQICAVL